MRQLINQNWFFQYGEHPGMETEAAPTGFSPIGLPHTFQLPYYGDSSFYVGYGVYQKNIYLSEEELAGDVLLEFLGVFQQMELFVNGTSAGGHKGGYTTFVCDITPYVRLGDNTLFVRVDNLWQATLPPRAGEHTFCGGIYRDVSLLTLPKARAAWNGIFIKTPQVSKTSATVTVETETQQAAGCVLTSSILDEQGNLVASMESTVEGTLTFQECTIESPALWSPEHPARYTLVSRLGETEERTPFGIRSICFDADTGFFLNGEHYLLEGVNVHQDRGGWGDACTRSGITRDLTMVKEAGFNLVRGSHYPKHPFFAQECDRLGLFFWSEATFWGIGGFQDEGFWNASAMPTKQEDFEAFEANCMTALEEMIRQGRNSPSILTWSMGNEIFFSKKEVLPAARELVGRMTEFAKKLDATRPASVGGTQRGDFHTIGDLTGFNGDGAVLFRHPKLPSLVAEYGSVVDLRPGKYRTHYTDGTEESLPWRSGRALWCGFHHGSIANIGNMGIIDLYRLPLRAYYCYREKLTGMKPPVFAKAGTAQRLELHCDRTEIAADGTEDCRFVVQLVDNSGAPVNSDAIVTLEVTTGEGLFPTGKTWVMQKHNGTFLDGAGAMELRAYHSGTLTVRATADGLPSAECMVTVTGDPAQEGPAVLYPACPPATSLIVAGDVDLLLNRPVKVSSEQAEHPRQMANDGDPATFWQPAGNDPAPAWRIDMENVYALRSVHLQLGAARCHVCIAVSDDGKAWHNVYRNRFAKRFSDKQLRICGKGRYLKVTVDNTRVQATSIRAFV